MPFTSFHDYFPELAERETRSLVVLPQSGRSLPAGSYGFLEMFCDEPGCDCRRVLFLVVTSFRPGPQATIAWGWEDVAFYAKWIKYGDRSEAPQLKGPILNPLSERTDLSEPILALARDVLLQDPQYVERVKRHYAIFRRRVDGPPAKPRKKRHARW